MWEGAARILPVEGNGADTKVMQRLFPHPSTRVTLDRYTQAVTPAKRLKLSGSTAVVSQFFPTGRLPGLPKP